MPTATPSGGDLTAQRQGEGLRACLGRAVGAHHRSGAERCGRGDLEEVTSGPLELGKEGPRGVRRPDQVDVDDASPQLGLGAGEGPADGDAGVGHDDVGRSEPLLDLPRSPVEGDLIGHVRLDADGHDGQ